MGNISIEQAITSLNITDWTIRGEINSKEDFYSNFHKVIGVDADGVGIESNDPSTFGVTYEEIIAKKDELEAAWPLKKLREERDRRIAETDWWASSDLTMSAERAAYRQALRDITNTYSSIDDVVWPTKPE